jgi:phospholipase C
MWGTRRLFTLALPLTVFASITAIVLPSSQSGAATHVTSDGAIQHVIVVMQSGHSFDNYFGTRAGVDGLPTKPACEPVAGSASCVSPYHLSSDQARAGLSDTYRVTSKAIDGGKMDGFVSAQPNASIGSVAMGYFDRSDLPYYWSLADRFTLFDHFNASSEAGALANRVVAVTGQDDGITSSAPPPGGIVGPTVFDQLDTAGLSWKYYVQNYKGTGSASASGVKIRAPVLDMPAFTSTPDDTARVVNSDQYFTDLTTGKLPAVSYVSGTVDSERSPQDPALGEAYVQSIINALMQSPEWSHTALLLTYDDSGGWYDHAVPPTIGNTTLGVRVPAILVSPYARPGFVDSSQTETASIPALIDQVFHLPTLTPQSPGVGSLMSGINLHQQPISPAIEPSQATALVRPDVSLIYVLYLGAFIVALAIIGLAFWMRRRANRPQPDGVLSSEAPA